MHLKRTIFTFVSLALAASRISNLNATAVTEPSTFQQDFTSVAQKAIPAVVSIQVKTKSLQNEENNPSFDFFNDDFLQRFFGSALTPQTPEMEMGQASGFIVSSDGYIITNSHVVKNATEIEVTLNDKRHFTAKVIGQDPSTDVAILKIDAKDLPYLKLGNSDDIKIGQWAIAIGTPLGLEASLTVGVISAKGRNNLDIARIEDFIQTDAAINRGNSGGPLLNLKSEVVGMNTAIVSNNGSGYMGIGFAIPSDIIKNDLNQILENGSISRGFIGVVLQQVDADMAQAMGLDKAEGALVSDVNKDSPADKAGIKQGDVILMYDGHSISSIGALRNAIALMIPGSKVKLTILRKGKSTSDVAVEVGNYPQQNEQQAPAKSQKENKLGIEVQELTPELARSLGYGEQKGVVISKILPNSPAAWAGLKKGILILSVNQQVTSTVDQFYKMLDANEASKPLLLLVKQGEFTRFISIRVK